MAEGVIYAAEWLAVAVTNAVINALNEARKLMGLEPLDLLPFPNAPTFGGRKANLSKRARGHWRRWMESAHAGQPCVCGIVQYQFGEQL